MVWQRRHWSWIRGLPLAAFLTCVANDSVSAPSLDGLPRLTERLRQLDESVSRRRTAQSELGTLPLAGALPEAFANDTREALVMQTLEMLRHAWSSYETEAMGHDELRPVTCEISDPFGEIAVFLIDGLSTLAVLGEHNALRRGVAWLEANLRPENRSSLFDTDARVNVFEMNIRVLGGLLSTHQLLVADPELVPGYQGLLLVLAEDMGQRLAPAFETETQIPLSWVNLRSGQIPGERNDTCLACAGTLLLEFGTLSRLTGNKTYERLARKALSEVAARRHNDTGLYGSDLDTATGAWNRRETGVGASMDSFFEYLLKAYLLFGDDTILEWFTDAYSSAQGFLKMDTRRKGEYWLVDALIDDGRPVSKLISSLGAFWPGMQALVGQTTEAEGLWAAYSRAWGHLKWLPELFDMEKLTPHNLQSGYPLRPEHIESAWMLESVLYPWTSPNITSLPMVEPPAVPSNNSDSDRFMLEGAWITSSGGVWTVARDGEATHSDGTTLNIRKVAADKVDFFEFGNTGFVTQVLKPGTTPLASSDTLIWRKGGHEEIRWFAQESSDKDFQDADARYHRFLHDAAFIQARILNGSRTKCGFASIQDVAHGDLSNHMESFFVAETCLYMWLLFSRERALLDYFVMSTEGHPLEVFPLENTTFQDSLPLMPSVVPETCQPICNDSALNLDDPMDQRRLIAELADSPALENLGLSKGVSDIDFNRALLLRRRRCLACVRVTARVAERSAEVPKFREAHAKTQAAQQAGMKHIMAAMQALQQQASQGGDTGMCPAEGAMPGAVDAGMLAQMEGHLQGNVLCQLTNDGGPLKCTSFRLLPKELAPQLLHALPRGTVVVQVLEDRVEGADIYDAAARANSKAFQAGQEFDIISGDGAADSKCASDSIGEDASDGTCETNKPLEPLAPGIVAVFGPRLRTHRETESETDEGGDVSLIPIEPVFADESNGGEDDKAESQQRRSDEIDPDAYVEHDVETEDVDGAVSRPPTRGIIGRLEQSDPSQACEPLRNPPETVKGAWVLMHRGGCQFIDKVMHAQDAGALGAIVAARPDEEEAFPMSGDGSRDALVNIASVMVTGSAGKLLQQESSKKINWEVEVVAAEDDLRYQIRLIVPPASAPFIQEATLKGTLQWDSVLGGDSLKDIISMVLPKRLQKVFLAQQAREQSAQEQSAQEQPALDHGLKKKREELSVQEQSTETQPAQESSAQAQPPAKTVTQAPSMEDTEPLRSGDAMRDEATREEKHPEDPK